MFKIDRTLHVRSGPFDKGLDLTILKAVESLIQKERGIPIQLSNVTYRETKSHKPGYREFHINSAYTSRDK